MTFKLLSRFIHFTRYSAASDKSALATLRKKTGYTFANCKKALDLHKNDLINAEKWLHEQAQSMGWAKAVKLEGRSTKQGLIGVLIQNNVGAMVEVNCETDFVARNKNFQDFVEIALKTCVQHMAQMPINEKLSKIEFGSDNLKELKTEDNKNLGDKLALMIGNVGENAMLRRALCYKSTNELILSGFAHPPSTEKVNKENQFEYGKYGSIIALQASTINDEINRQICQHIVGMNPQKVGTRNVDEPLECKDDETCLIYQEYLLEPTVTVEEVLQENNIKIVDFHRFECGENVTNGAIEMAGNVNVAAASN